MRWLALFCGAASAAIFALQYGPAYTALLLLLLAGCAVLGALFLKKPRRMAALALACGLVFGSSYDLLYDMVLVKPAQPLEGTEQIVTVTLCAYPQSHTYGAKCNALLDVGAVVPVKVCLYGDDKLLQCAPGDRVTVRANLRSASMIRGKRITAFTSKGIHLLAYGKGDMTVEHPQHLPVRYLPLYLNQFLQEKTDRIYTGQARILMYALLTGDRTEFDDPLYSKLSETGLTHVTAVSGMHCAFLFGMLGLLIRSRKRRALIGLPVLFLFALMVGAAPSVSRACFMLAILSLAPLFHRENDSATTLSFVLLLLLLRNPFAAASIGLQLSFLSVAGILLFARRINRALYRGIVRDRKGRHAVAKVICSALATTCAASVLTLPLVACYFGCVSLISPLANLLCLWAVNFAFCGGLISLLVSFVSVPVAAIVAVLPAASLDYFMAVAGYLGSLPYHAIYTNNPYLPGWLLYFYAMLLIVLLSKQRRRRTVVLSAALALSTLCLTVALPPLANGRATLQARVLDVGQGESVLLLSNHVSALVDCGSSNSWVNAGTVAANELNTQGCAELDYLILTHYHSDHANGLDTLFSRVRVRNLIAPQLTGTENETLQEEVLALAEQYGTNIVLPTEELTLPLGVSGVTIYPPQGSTDTNELGLSVLCSCEDFDMLVTGDMDSETEQRLLLAADVPDIEVLVVSHHGSKYSSSSVFLEEITPEVTVIPVGDNSYGHPAPATLRRLERVGAEVRRTDRDGTVSITVY